MERVAILGASRGLGRCFVQEARKGWPEAYFFLASRKKNKLDELKNSSAEILSVDFTKDKDQDALFKALFEFDPTRVFYIAGGGPHGPYHTKTWKDHQWALELGLLFPARLVHELLRWAEVPRNLRQAVFVGSQVAEDLPDPMASSYAAAKHGLRGLITSLQKEDPKIDLKLFSPGYMDTELLPPNAWPRQKSLAEDPRQVAKRLWDICHVI